MSSNTIRRNFHHFGGACFGESIVIPAEGEIASEVVDNPGSPDWRRKSSIADQTTLRLRGDRVEEN
jgi:hypothetical protein